MIKIRVFFRKEFEKLLSGILISALILVLLGVWRIFDEQTFLFSQIVLLSFATYFLLLNLRTSPSLFKGNELVSVLIAFTLISTLTLNIDRSRSVFVIKWVSTLSSTSPTTLDEIIKYKNFTASESSAIMQRLAEQEQIGMLNKSPTGYRLTFLGNCFIKVSQFLAKVLHLKGFEES